MNVEYRVKRRPGAERQSHADAAVWSFGHGKTVGQAPADECDIIAHVMHQHAGAMYALVGHQIVYDSRNDSHCPQN